MPTSESEHIRKIHKFPTRMFATAACVSAFMFLMISVGFAQENAPCLHSYSMQNSTIVNTSHNFDTQTTEADQPLALCNRNNQQIGWLTWLFKRSDSAEFHYLDLLELLSR